MIRKKTVGQIGTDLADERNTWEIAQNQQTDSVFGIPKSQSEIADEAKNWRIYCNLSNKQQESIVC